jgi:CheY-like chemotaxis protein
MDIGLPDLDGLEVDRRLRASRPQTEVIVVGAYDPVDYASPARAAGTAAFVMKGGIAPAKTDLADCRAVTMRQFAMGQLRSTGRVEGVVVGPEVVRARESNAAAEPSTVGRRILVVDDEPSMRTVCRFNLLAAGFDVREAGDGQEALELIREEAVDLVLLDVMMPVLDGWEVARELQADPRTRDLPVVFLTARAERADRERAADLGAVGYVLKPFDPVGLPATIENILEQLARGEGESLRRAIRESIDG